MFFLLLSFRFYTPLKNDGRGELRFQRIFYCCVKRKEYKSKAVPGHGEGGGGSRRKGQVGAETLGDFFCATIKFMN